MSRHPITHGPGPVGGVDLIPVELTEIRYLLGPQPGDLSLCGKDPLLQLIDPFIPIPTIEHMFVISNGWDISRPLIPKRTKKNLPPNGRNFAPCFAVELGKPKENISWRSSPTPSGASA